jgi:DNA-binding MarR family transcriptional regulator
VRETNQEDNRALRLTLTGKGAALLHEAVQAHQNFNQKRFGCLNAIEKGTLQQNLDTLNAYLETVIRAL